MNPAAWVEHHARRRPGDPALADGDRVHASWGEFAARTAGAATSPRDDFGLSPGDRVAIVMRNKPEYLEALFAIWHAGLAAVPVNARLHRDEIAYILQHSASALAVTDADHADDVGSLVGTVASLKAAVVTPGERWDRLTGSPPARNSQRRLALRPGPGRAAAKLDEGAGRSRPVGRRPGRRYSPPHPGPGTGGGVLVDRSAGRARPATHH